MCNFGKTSHKMFLVIASNYDFRWGLNGLAFGKLVMSKKKKLERLMKVEQSSVYLWGCRRDTWQRRRWTPFQCSWCQPHGPSSDIPASPRWRTSTEHHPICPGLWWKKKMTKKCHKMRVLWSWYNQSYTEWHIMANKNGEYTVFIYCIL